MKLYSIRRFITREDLEDEIYKNSPDKKKFVDKTPMTGIIIQDKKKPYQLEFRQDSQLMTQTPPVADIFLTYSGIDERFRSYDECLSERAYHLFQDLLEESLAQIEECFYENQAFYLFKIPRIEDTKASFFDAPSHHKKIPPFVAFSDSTFYRVTQAVYDRTRNQPLRGCYLSLYWSDES
jgi:hypothetical protein